MGLTQTSGFPDSAVGKESACNAGEHGSWVRKICWRRDRLPTPVFLGFPCGSAGKESAWNAGDLGSIPGLGISLGEGIGYPLQYSWASLVAHMIKNPPARRGPWFDSWVKKILWRRDRLPTPVFLGFPGGSYDKESACNMGDLGSIPGMGRSPAEGIGYSLQYFGASLVAQLVKNLPAM